MFGENKIRDALKAERRSYADNTPEADENTLDCSLGVNPYGFPDRVIEVLANFDAKDLYQYPHGNEAREAVVQYWEGKAFIEPENVVMTDGSISALCLLVNTFAAPDTEMVCFLPTFTDMTEYAKQMGMKITGVEAKVENNYKECVDELVEKITDKTTIVYIDNPNNPTGQTLTFSELRRILDKCEEKGVFCIVDEAYADFLPVEESAVNLGPDYKCMVSVRTFSKGFGLAGLRAGYIIAQKELVRIIAKLSNPYMMNEVSRKLTSAILTNPTQPWQHGVDFAIIKGALRDACGEKIVMAETDDRVPICTLRHVDENVDLQAYLMQENILTCSGVEFVPFGKNCVRLRVPTLQEAGKLIMAIRKLSR